MGLHECFTPTVHPWPVFGPANHENWIYDMGLCSQQGLVTGQATLTCSFPLNVAFFYHPTLISLVLIALKLSAHLRELNRMFYRALGRLTINKKSLPSVLFLSRALCTTMRWRGVKTCNSILLRLSVSEQNTYYLSQTYSSV